MFGTRSRQGIPHPWLAVILILLLLGAACWLWLGPPTSVHWLVLAALLVVATVTLLYWFPNPAALPLQQTLMPPDPTVPLPEDDAYRQLQIAHERLTRTLAVARIGTWDWDLLSNEITWSDNFEEVLGIEGRLSRSLESFLSVVVPEHQPLIRQRIAEALTNKDKFDLETMEFRLVSKKPRWIEGGGRLFRDAEGRPVRMMGTIIDVTSRRLMMDELRRASEAKSSFLAYMSHEMRTPLNGIIGMIEVLAQTPVTQQQRGYLEVLSTSAESLLAQIDGILDISKIESGRLELESIPFDPRELAEDALRVVTPQALRKGLHVVSDFDPDLPERLLGDQGRLRQVLLNLLSNAVKFTERGTVSLQVTIVKTTASLLPFTPLPQGRGGLSPDPSPHGGEGTGGRADTSPVWLRFEVRDTGIGIAPERQQVIFEPFAQADSSTRRTYGGTGLGLSISARLVELMGGQLTLTSALGQGSTFTFTIPLAQAVEPLPVVEEAADPTPPPMATRAARILLVEDNPVNQQVMTLLLEKVGHQVEAATNGREALERLEQQRFDVVLMDVQMPEMDGLRATRLIRQREKAIGGHVPIIAVTANAVLGERQRCLLAGMDEYLSKPVRGPELYEMLDRLLGANEPAVPASSGSAVVPTTVPAWLTPLQTMGFDDAAIRKLVRTFLDTVPPRLDTLRQALEQGEATRVQQTAHSLKGSLNVFGVRSAIEMAAQLEQVGREGRLDQGQVLLRQLSEEIATLMTAMRQHLRE